MTDTNTQPEPTSKSPSHFVYHVRDGQQKGFWTKIGATWQHKDSKGFNIQLDCIPLDGRLSLRPRDTEGKKE